MRLDLLEGKPMRSSSPSLGSRTQIPDPLHPAPPSPRSVDAIYRPFFRAGIAVVLTAGAVWGAYLLLRIGWTGSFRAAGLHEVNAHGHAQIFGWVGLFVMGFAYQAFPRFKHTTLALPSLAWASLGLMLVGIVGRSLGQPLASSLSGAGLVAVLSAWLEVLAVALFVVVILATWRASGKGLALYDYYILAALTWFTVQAVFEAVYLYATLAAASRQDLIALVATWQGPLRDIQIHGFALLIILGVSQRLLPSMFGFPAPNPRVSLGALIGINLAVVGEVVALVMMRGAPGPWAGLWLASILVLTGSVALLVWNLGVFRPVAEADRSLKFLRAAYSWLLLSLVLLLLVPVYQFALLPSFAPSSEATRIGFSHAYHGAIRHAITVGFISLMIMGVAARVVPTLNGVLPDRLRGLWGPFLLINVGCALRVSGQTSTDFTASTFPVMALSGLLEVTALAWWGSHLWAIMAGWGTPREEAGALNPGDPIEPHHTVGAVLTCYPETLETFLALGFRPLVNPVLRSTLARVVRLEVACRFRGVDLSKARKALNETRRPLPCRTVSLPLLSNP